MAHVAKPIIIFMSKIINTNINGKEISLLVSIPRFYNLYKEITGKDLLVISRSLGESEEMVTLIEIAKGIVCAGYFTGCQKNKVSPELTKEEIFEFIDFAEDNYHIKIINQWSATQNSNGIELGEVVSQPNHLSQ